MVSRESDCTEQDLINAIMQLEIEADGENAPTIKEIAKEMGVGVETARIRMGILSDAGKIDVVWVKRTSISGIRTSVPGYKLKVVDAARV